MTKKKRFSKRIHPKRWFWKSTLRSNSVIVHRWNVLYVSNEPLSICPQYCILSSSTIHSRSLPLRNNWHMQHLKWRVSKNFFGTARAVREQEKGITGLYGRGRKKQDQLYSPYGAFMSNSLNLGLLLLILFQVYTSKQSA